MIGTQGTDAMLCITASSSIIQDIVELLPLLEQEQVRAEVEAGRTIRLVIDIGQSGTMFNLLSHQGKGIAMRFIGGLADDRPRGDWLRSLILSRPQ